MTMQFGGSLLTRTPAAKLCGVSVSALRKWQRKGKISAIQNHRGWNLFSRDELLALAEQRGHVQPVSPSVARLAFKLFDEGKSWKDVVRHANVLPQQALELWQYYQMDDRPTSPATVQALEEARAKEQEAVAQREEAARREQEEYDESIAAWQREQREAMENANRQREKERNEWRKAREKAAESSRPISSPPPSPPSPSPREPSRKTPTPPSVSRSEPAHSLWNIVEDYDKSPDEWVRAQYERLQSFSKKGPPPEPFPTDATTLGASEATMAGATQDPMDTNVALLLAIQEFLRRQ